MFRTPAGIFHRPVFSELAPEEQDRVLAETRGDIEHVMSINEEVGRESHTRFLIRRDLEGRLAAFERAVGRRGRRRPWLLRLLPLHG
jgi:hypothetical protein